MRKKVTLHLVGHYYRFTVKEDRVNCYGRRWSSVSHQKVLCAQGAQRVFKTRARNLSLEITDERPRNGWIERGGWIQVDICPGWGNERDVTLPDGTTRREGLLLSGLDTLRNLGFDARETFWVRKVVAK